MELESASREIMWNVSSIWNSIGMYTLLLLSSVVAGIGVLRHAEMWLAGQGQYRNCTGVIERIDNLIVHALFQKGTVRQKNIALAHSLIFLGFLVLLFTTTMVFLDHDFGIPIYEGRFYLATTLMSDLFGFFLLIGLAMAAHRRYVLQPDYLHNRPGDAYLLGVLALLCVQGFLLEALRIHVTQDQWAAYSPIGWGLSVFFWPISGEAATWLHFFMWWFHTITVMGALALLPYTKLFHAMVSPLNLFLVDSNRPKGALPFTGDIEKLIEAGEDFSVGLGTIKDYSWKQLLDLDACTSCGRCQDACPAYLSGKPLSPKWLILDSRNHALALNANDKMGDSLIPKPLRALDSALGKHYLESTCGLEADEQSGGYLAQGAFRAENELVQKNNKVLGADADMRISGDVIDQDVFWACTTCMACVEACPVGINHVDQIVENRRNMVLMQGEVPSEAQGTLRALETRGNPFGAPEDRMNWAKDLDLKVLEAGDEVEYLYWVGCISAFDQRKQKIAQAMVELLNAAGLSWGVLGNAEGCTGDPARRLGEENLFQTLAKSNIETLKSVKFEVLVANCPHCFNTIKNEYPQLGNLGEGREPQIIHHSKLLRHLLDSGKLEMKEGSMEEVTFHDPCYLGRYNDEYDAPRDTLKKANSKLKIVEMDRSREKGLCCGAGGGHFWHDMKIGERVNSLRVDEAAETGASKIAAACPFCMQMLEDGAKLTGREDSIAIRDIAEVLVENLKQ